MAYSEIGPWSEIKLEIVQKYAKPYSQILNAQNGLRHIYIDAFAGSGVHYAKGTQDLILGSPLRALGVNPPFNEFHFIDIKAGKVSALRSLVGERPNVHIYEGDCNSILLDTVFSKAKYEDYKRALCLLDPYGLHLDWNIIHTAGQMRSIDLFLNFLLLDMNRNVFLRNPDRIDADQEKRMDTFWGDNSWRALVYGKQLDLLDLEYKLGTDELVKAFRQRLRDVAGFEYVPEPIEMTSPTNNTLYFLFFASQKEVAARIANDIFEKYRKEKPPKRNRRR